RRRRRLGPRRPGPRVIGHGVHRLHPCRGAGPDRPARRGPTRADRPAGGRALPPRLPRNPTPLGRLLQPTGPLPDRPPPPRRPLLAAAQHPGNPAAERGSDRQRLPRAGGGRPVEAGPVMTPVRTVSRFEANLLQILRFFLRRAPRSQALPLLFKTVPRP